MEFTQQYVAFRGLIVAVQGRRRQSFFKVFFQENGKKYPSGVISRFLPVLTLTPG